MSGRNDTWVVLSTKAVNYIFLYYAILLISGLFVSVWVILQATSPSTYNDNLRNAIFGSLGISAVGSSVYYIRKMYKTCIKQNVCKPNDNQGAKYREIGTQIYFVIRPIFALGFSVLVVVGLSSGLITITVKSKELSHGFVFVCMFLSFFCGFSSGRFINVLESRGEKIISALFLE